MQSTFKSFSLAILLATLLIQLVVPPARAGVVTNIFTFQKGNLQTNGVAYGSGSSYGGVVDGAINDNTATSALATGSTNTLGTAFASGNGRQYCGLFSYDLTELNTFITANTSAYSSVQVTSVSFQLLSAGGVTGTATAIGLYGTDPFTSTCTWSNYTTGIPWTVAYQNIGSSAQYGYTGGGSVLTASLGGANPNTGIASGSLLTWTSSSNFIVAITNALARSDKTLYLTANSSLGNTDHRLNFNCSSVGTVSYRPALSVTLQITTTAAPGTWTGASGTSWATAGNWSPAGVPGTDAPIIFDTPSTANLNTVLNQNFAIVSLSVTNPTGSISIGGANSLTIGAGGINLSAATKDATITAPLALGASQIWTVTNTRSLSVNGGVSGSAALTLSGSGKVSLGGAATYTGDTTVSSGSTLQLGADNALPNVAGGGNVTDSGVLDMNGHTGTVNGLNGNGVLDNTAVGAATLTVGNNNTNSSFSGKIQNTGGALALVKTGTGTLTLSTSNTYSGGTTIANGIVVPGNGSVFGTGPITNSGTAYPVTTMTITNPLVLNGGFLRVGGGTTTVIWSGPVSVTNGFVMAGDNNGNVNNVSGSIDIGTGGIYLTNNTGNGQAQAVLGDILSGTISGSGGITYYCNGGNSRLTVQGANTYSGGTIVNGTGNGKLNVYGGLNPFSTGTVTLNAGAVIEAYPGNVTITNALNLNGGILEGESQYNDYNRLTWAGPITLTANSTLYQFGQNSGQMSQGLNVTGSLNINGYTLTNSGNSGLFSGSIISGPITGTGSILETVNILYLQGSNTFSGTFRPVGGNITVQNVNAMQNATLDMNAADSGSVTLINGAVIGALTGSRNLNLTGFTLLIGNNNSSTNYNGALTNSGSLTKVGTGTFTLSGANTYPGITTINGGTLALSGSGSLASSVIAVAGGATFDTSAGSFTLGAGQILSNTASATAQLVGPLSSGSGTLSVSFVNGTPSFNIAGGTLTLSGATVVSVRNTGAALAPGTYKIISASGGGSVSGTAPTSVSVINGPSAGTPSLAIVGGELYLTVGGTANFSYGSTTLTYNGAARTTPIVYSGSTGVRTTNFVGTGLTTYAGANAPTNVGTYYVSNTVATDANYFGATNSQSFNITSAALGIKPNDSNKSYGQTVTFAGTEFIATGLLGSDSVTSVTLTSAGATNTAVVGSYSIVASAAVGSGLSNYNIAYTNGSLTVNQASTSIGGSSTANPSGFKDSVAFIATLPTDATGNVVFSTTNGVLSTNVLSSGSATSSVITNLLRGLNVITVAYLGDSNYFGSTNSLNQTVTNHPPIANNPSYTRNAAVNTFKVLVSDLLSNATDFDADNLTLASIGPTTNNATVLVTGSYVLYANTNAVADQFSYTVSDGFGGTNTGTVTLNLSSTPLFGQSAILSTSGGTATLSFAGIADYSYSVSRTTNLLSWVTIWTTNAPVGGLFQFVDTSAPLSGAFYRLQFNP
jgi:autotransporter-associated beta strand protein